MGEALGDCEKLIESARPREYEWGGVEYDVVAHPVRVGVRDETVVRPIMVKCRSEIKSNEAEVVPSFATGIVKDDESPAGCNWVREEVVGLAINSVVGRDRWKVSVGSLKVECQFSLGKEGRPMVDWERRMSRCKETEKMSSKGLNRAFCSVGTFLVRGNWLVSDVLTVEVGEERL